MTKIKKGLDLENTQLGRSKRLGLYSISRLSAPWIEVIRKPEFPFYGCLLSLLGEVAGEK